MKKVLYYGFAATLVCTIACVLTRCHFAGYPHHYGWPAYWYSYANDASLGNSEYTFTNLPNNQFLVVSHGSGPTRIDEFDTTYYISHLLWGLSTLVVLFSSWHFVARLVPRLSHRHGFSLKSLMIATTLFAITVVMMQTRPRADDFKRAERFQMEYPTVFVGLDPTSTWSPWYHRCPIISGLVCTLVVAGRAGFQFVYWIANTVRQIPASV